MSLGGAIMVGVGVLDSEFTFDIELVSKLDITVSTSSIFSTSFSDAPSSSHELSVRMFGSVDNCLNLVDQNWLSLVNVGLLL